MPDTRSNEFIAEAREAGAFCFDCEHNPEKKPHLPGFELLGVSFATATTAFFEQDLGEVKRIVQALFPTEAEAIAYNLKYDLKCLAAAEIIDSYQYPKAPRDPMIAMNLQDENRKLNQLGLKPVVRDVFRHEMMTFEEAWKYGPSSSEFEQYAIDDAVWEYKLHLQVKKCLASEDAVGGRLWKLFTTILMPASLVFADIEQVGVGWDVDGARTLLRGFQELRMEMQGKIQNKIGMLNLASGDQLAKRLFDELGYSTRGIAMTRTGKRFSTDVRAMESLARRYEVCDWIMKWRTAAKMINTYVEPMTRAAMADVNSRAHPTFWQVSTTGRTRCEKPPLQTIPAWLNQTFNRLNIRKNIIPRPGWSMLVADLSQIELRLCGHISGDEAFLRAYVAYNCTQCGSTGQSSKLLHECPQCHTAENEGILKDPSVKGFWHGLDLHQMTTESVQALQGSRQNGKRANFALIYYATAGRMAYEYPDLSRDRWQEVIDQYFKKYVGVRGWHQRMEKQLYSEGECTSLFGRKRRILRQDIRANPKHALNMFINFPVQASACELMQLCMVKLRERWMKSDDWMRTIIQSNMVHDEGVWECVPEENARFIADIHDVFENTVQFKVPIRVEVKVVDNWGAAK
jgi:DNA polymerase I-like protein with 3'-5' exonuclease and polymerase domains